MTLDPWDQSISPSVSPCVSPPRAPSCAIYGTASTSAIFPSNSLTRAASCRAIKVRPEQHRIRPKMDTRLIWVLDMEPPNEDPILNRSIVLFNSRDCGNWLCDGQIIIVRIVPPYWTIIYDLTNVHVFMWLVVSMPVKRISQWQVMIPNRMGIASHQIMWQFPKMENPQNSLGFNTKMVPWLGWFGAIPMLDHFLYKTVVSQVSKTKCPKQTYDTYVCFPIAIWEPRTSALSSFFRCCS